MYQPDLFVKSNDLPKNAARLAIKNLLHLMNINDDGLDSFLEVGCGPADVTKHILLPSLPRNFKKFISSDISEVMIQYAKLNNADDRISYEILDIETQESLEKFGVFNHIFCFFVLPFVHNHRYIENVQPLTTDKNCLLFKLLCSTLPYKMNLPELYSQFNNVTKNQADQALKKFLHLLNIRNDGSEKFLEIGCGPGDITKHILLPVLPETFEKFISSDISEEMVKYADLENHDSRIVYKILDIETKENLGNLGLFNHIFCFFVFHWVQNQRQALKNMNELLTPGGNILVTQVTTCPYFDMYEHVVKKGLWTDYMYDYKKYVTPYYRSEDPMKEFRDILVEQGFFVNRLELHDKCHEFSDIASFRNLMEAVNPFLIRIPKTLHKDYVADLLNAAKELNIITGVENNAKVSFNFKVMEVVATKLSL